MSVGPTPAEKRLRESCIIWGGKIDNRGYGRNGSKMAHRVAYENAKGPIPEGLTIDHLCRNPPCVNPDHLEAVTLRENVLRGYNPPAINARKTHCPQGHEYTPENTYAWRGYRYCRTCNRAHVASHKIRLRQAQGAAQ